ncbi:hypothetical protein [Amycolatopsis sp. NPDC004079]
MGKHSKAEEPGSDEGGSAGEERSPMPSGARAPQSTSEAATAAERT